MSNTCISNSITILKNGDSLSRQNASEVAKELASSSISLDDKKTLLEALHSKGEVAEEITGFAECYRNLARNPGVETWAPKAIDVCGTGGDHSGSFNISTTVSLILASCGIPVFKHGNRSITSKCGSSQLLEAIGIPITATDEEIRNSIESKNFCFFFAPSFHPAFKEIVPVRQQMASEGKRSIFNILGPLINPGKPETQLLGVFSKKYASILADALDKIPLKRALVVHGTSTCGQAIDELTCSGTNYVFGAGELKDTSTEWTPQQFGLSPCSLSDLAGGDATENLKILNNILSASCNKGLYETILLNTGTALWVNGAVANVEDGITTADNALKNGLTKEWLKSW